MSGIISNEKSCCVFIDKFDEFWDENKYRISSKLSIMLGISSGVGSALIGLHLLIPASIVLGCVSAGVFFSGIILSKYENKTINLEKDNNSLKQELTKRITLYDNFKFPNGTPSAISENIIPPSNVSTETHYEPIYEVKFN